ncbi:putative Bro-N domain-containing protein 12 [Diachasmimorpha longicaudata entomopoxvirus]|uniref:Putative Bro-N domain-containing protein 12 n=1 Tax=Diachasmimorpha longicaudata entomopoxvirus TaxID=109981 RepID=A0A7R5WNU2_9POXV|nr:putative Bro-N domain-containing protein 12 [Diachasmimorpha longicaudata entomopoxvirus]AKS26396.1 putative Bro-N domain-containing protein 12 [Diachasmimorpha longicaudata entomopoxvirus]
MNLFHYDYFFDRRGKYERYQIYIYVDHNMCFWFKGVDVSAALQHKQPNKIIHQRVRSEHKIAWVDIVGKKYDINDKWRPEATFLTEKGISILMKATYKSAADKFYCWLYTDVLPDIKERLEHCHEYRLYKKFEGLQKQIDALKSEIKTIKNFNKSDKPDESEELSPFQKLLRDFKESNYDNYDNVSNVSDECDESDKPNRFYKPDIFDNMSDNMFDNMFDESNMSTESKIILD